MVSWIRKFLFSKNGKSANAPHVFLVLCFYVAFNIVYTFFIMDLRAGLIRTVSGLLILIVFIVLERSRLKVEIVAFLSPAFLLTIFYACAAYFNLSEYNSGDVLIFTYVLGGSMVSLTYLKPKGLMLYIGYNLVVGVVLLLSGVNLMGGDYSTTHNVIFLITSLALSIVIYVF